MAAQCTSDQQYVNEIQITFDEKGHCLNTTQCYSANGKMIVYDARNVDSGLAANGEIRVFNLETREDKLVYQSANQTAYGPGVGAVTFSPVADRVLFLAGIKNADESRPYSITRRTGVAVDINKPGQEIRMDARDINAPYTAGALRGGTHAHSWSGDGKWISFTYNDEVLHQAVTTGGGDINKTNIIDTRTVGVMFPGAVPVLDADDIENISGTMRSVIITQVVKNPSPGSDEISRAFDECWIGSNGYILPDGSRQQRAIAFQGELIDDNGHKKTEIFVADLPDDLATRSAFDYLPGTATSLPPVPAGIHQRRISFTAKGVSPAPRHWLRSSPDGSMIAFLAEDANGIIQLWTISPNGGAPVQRTKLESSIMGPFNFNSTGSAIAFTADGSVFVTRLRDNASLRLTSNDHAHGWLAGAVNWSPVEDQICYNRYVKSGSKEYLQIFIADVEL